MNVITKTISLPDGRTISIETGKVAKQADGSAVVRMGNTVLLATVCAAKDAVPGTDFMPLQVDYKEQYSACRLMVLTNPTLWPVWLPLRQWHVQIFPSISTSAKFVLLALMASMLLTPPSNK